MLPRLLYFFAGIFGYGQLKREQRAIRQELEDELALQRELSGGSGSGLSRLEKEMRAAEEKDAK